MKQLIATSRPVANLAGLAEMLGHPVVHRKAVRDMSACAGVVAWGLKPSAAAAAAFASRHRLDLLRLEDGFLRSIDLGDHEPPLSIVVDDLGIYYNASAPSRLESLVTMPLSDTQRTRTRTLIRSWRSARVSKYNHSREFAGPLPERYVLAVDQTPGDASIRHGLADASSFQTMLQAALSENPGCAVLLKIHPQVLAGRKKSHFDLETISRNPRIHLIARDVHPVSLIERASAVYVVTSQIGFEGLLWGKRVRTLGMPFYAGWGLTEDELPAPKRRKPVALENLAHAALIEYPRYLDPETGKRCQPERLIEWMGLQRRMRERFPQDVYALGFSLWKKPIVRTFFQGSNVKFIRTPARAPAGATLAAWGRKAETRDGHLHAAEGTKVVRLEDGFLRSVGLGVDLVRPLSWVADSRGMYYDATCPSDLEYILNTRSFDQETVERASHLRKRIASLGLTKYNVGSAPWQRPYPGKSVILVPGQVESDASIRYGASRVVTNMELLKSVRAANPGAYVVYKPHPDVAAGLRRKGSGEADAGQWCDEVLTDAPMGELLNEVDEVHVLTSLTGFEALLRGRRVVTYGVPFYAGWGLTEDRAPCARRTRRLSLDELVAGVLIEYPVYVSRSTGRFTTPERALDELSAWRGRDSGFPWWRKGLRLALRLGARRR